ncbi:MAG: DUF4157 domain-containing protein [Proteobacteria bacterium]|nr:DUF4157 domain-containing protein [Pseudomonadota bacterium]
MADEEDSSLVNRLISRSDTGLHRVALPGGGEAYKGPLAQRALRAVGARAMTMDKSVFVDEHFDASSPEDQALYAHEVHHQMESGGADDGHSGHDHEEFAARAIERMVLHRASDGEDFGTILRDVQTGAGADVAMRAATETGPQTQTVSGSADAPEGDDPMMAYQAMRAQGKSHGAIVRELSQFVLKSLDQVTAESRFRSGPSHFL